MRERRGEERGGKGLLVGPWGSGRGREGEGRASCYFVLIGE